MAEKKDERNQKEMLFLSSSVSIFFPFFSSKLGCCFKRQFDSSEKIPVYSSQNENRMLVSSRNSVEKKKTAIMFSNVTTFSRLLIADKLVCIVGWNSRS
jgi:hypothetical protein